jgi:hypothetical protein
MEDSLDVSIHVKLGLWKHYKGGLYEVIGMAKHSETLEDMVVYRHQCDDKLWVRPVNIFLEPMPQGGSRFHWVDDVKE